VPVVDEAAALLWVGAALEDCPVVCATFVCFRVVDCTELLDLSTNNELAPVAELAVLVLLTIDGLAEVVGFFDVVGFFVDFGAAVVLLAVCCVVVVPALWQICCGPTPAKKATTRFCPSTPWPPHAF
jgi:hypothetical protein